ncbi:DUF2490 domain-containing protein [Flavobacterium sp. F372]|uniref:DUF2490 domain-containing protein n=1 Tax=Flavobacterium bernardetii TaxID=2813823 RepID=A0ABR7J1S2_9FLAO|nr:DUF2490 domain-containing protein [Flavobacterium bernardetii]MBC5835980.1 DUF2490 domain-containing protein [Flavobacterium bernardetii]NHF71074.1 DUF2490 domain-containing protein [Flavobacterium bernardetii]
MKRYIHFLVALVGLLGILLPNSSSAQTKTSNNDVWFHYVGKNMLTKKLSFTLEATMRYANGVSEKQQYFVRPSFDYQFTKKFNGSIGYSHYNTYVYGSPALNKKDIPEDHVWIQGTFVHTKGKFKFTHRLRDENRFVGIAVKNGTDYSIDRYEYRNRLRYMFLMNYTLTKKEDKVKLFGIVGNEAFFNLGSNAGKTFFNQNRIIGGIGYNIDKNQQIQLSYIHQNIWNYSNTLQESNPTIRISYITNLDFSKKE